VALALSIGCSSGGPAGAGGQGGGGLGGAGGSAGLGGAAGTNQPDAGTGGAGVDAGGSDAGNADGASVAALVSTQFVSYAYSEFFGQPCTSNCGDGILIDADGTISTFGCDGFTGANRTNCLAIAACLRGAACKAAIAAATPDYQEAALNFDDPHPCLCGSVSLNTCTGLSTFTGVCAPEYAAAATALGTTVASAFSDITTPLAIANNVFSCDIDSSVAGSGTPACGSICGVGTGP